MKREEQKILREIKKEFPKMLKDRAKKRKIKMVREFIFIKQDEYFFVLNHNIYKSKHGFKIDSSVRMKPYEYDNVFWDMFDISDNKLKPESFRAYGAYVSPIVTINRHELAIGDKSEIEDNCEKLLDFFETEVESMIEKTKAYSSYLEFIKANIEYNNNELYFIIGEIESGNYKEAIRLMRVENDSGKPARFAADQKSIYEFGIEYCTKKLNELI